MWQAQNDAHDDLIRKPLSHFERCIEIQFEEMRQHLAQGNKEAAAREAADIVSIGLNYLRWLPLR